MQWMLLKRYKTLFDYTNLTFLKNFVEVHFTEDSAGGLDTLLKLYQFGVINFDRFSSCALRIAGMDQDLSMPQGE